MHPEDVKFGRQARAKAKKLLPAFAAKHRARIDALIGVYPDVKAARELARLRMKFWSMPGFYE